MIAVLRVHTHGAASVEAALSKLAEATGEQLHVNVRDSYVRALGVADGDDVSEVMEVIDRLPGRITAALDDDEVRCLRGAVVDIGLGPEDSNDRPYLSLLICSETMAALSAMGIDVIVTVYGLRGD